MLQELTTERPKVRAGGSLPRRSKLSAHYEALLQRIRAANLGAAIGQAIGVTSCAPRAGVSTVALNIAVTADRAGYGPVLLVDADVYKQPSSDVLQQAPDGGLVDAILNTVEPLDCVNPSQFGELSIVTGRGKHSPNVTGIDGRRFAELLTEYKRHFSLVVVDLPAPSELNNSVCLAGQLDGVLLVVEAERADGRVALKIKQQLIEARANVLGVVLNKRRQHVPDWLYRRL